jgi:hypothetical protein
MSGMRPFFITGANAKIRLNNKTLAYCTDLSYSVQIITQTPKILGMYEGSSVEPLGYNVGGSFTVVRYTKGARDAIKAKTPNGIAPNDAGNGVGNWGAAWGGGLSGPAASLGFGENGRANEAMNPATFAEGTTFDIQVFQKTPNGDIGVANIRNCRVTQADFQISKKGAAIQRFSFVALYADEDSFAADFSGKGQHFEG